MFSSSSKILLNSASATVTTSFANKISIFAISCRALSPPCNLAPSKSVNDSIFFAISNTRYGSLGIALSFPPTRSPITVPGSRGACGPLTKKVGFTPYPVPPETISYLSIRPLSPVTASTIGLLSNAGFTTAGASTTNV